VTSAESLITERVPFQNAVDRFEPLVTERHLNVVIDFRR